ncbi:MAG TPA: non-heme iron oxygenase ferredoxin subunit [Anaerolineaceae bacterium]|nr:non-heme iron oxygenase ferredoxin subunit [Anaerolineaceae bacterium]
MFNYRQIDEANCKYYPVAPLNDLPPGERMFIEIGERYIVIFNIAEELYAIGDVCSHDGGPVGDGELEGYEVICPRHGARFDVRTGKVLSLPAVVDIPAYPVRVVNEMVEIGVPEEQ